jgi:hypothetical protein
VGDLLEGIVLHAFDGLCPFQEESLRRIRELKRIYKLDLDASASHHLIEAGLDERRPARKTKRPRVGKRKT